MTDNNITMAAAADLAAHLGEGLTFVRRMVRALDIAAEGLRQEEERDALQQLVTAISDRLRALGGTLTELNNMLVTAKTKKVA